MSKGRRETGKVNPEQLAAYRDLSAQERRELQEKLAQDPAAAELLSAFRRMDRELAALADPRPEPRLRSEFYAALEREAHPSRRQTLRHALRQLPGAAGQVAAAAVLLLLLVGAGLLFRGQLQLLSAPDATAPATGSATPDRAIGDPRGTAAASPTSPDASPVFPEVTPTFAVTVDASDPFAPFAGYMARWPEQTGMAHGSLRAGMKAYLQRVGGLVALQDAQLMADLQAQLQPQIPSWGQHSLQLVDLYGDETPELIVVLRPFVDVYTQDAQGILHVGGLGIPRYWPVEQTIVTDVEALDFSGDGRPELTVTYTFGSEGRRSQEVLVAQYDPARNFWEERLRVPIVDAGVAQDMLGEPFQPVQVTASQDGPPTLEITCAASGAFDAAFTGYLLRRELYLWNGSQMEMVLADRTEATTLGQYVNVSEAYLRQGHFTRALERYEWLYAGNVDLPAGTVTSGGQIGWRAFAAMRAGQIHALLGHQEEARAALLETRLSSSMIGLMAGYFAERYRATGDAAAAWAAMVTEEVLYEDPAQDADMLREMLYPGMALAAAWDKVSTAGADPLDSIDPYQALLDELGLEILHAVQADMDGDGAGELVVAQPLPSGEIMMWVLDRGEEGAFAAPLGLARDREQASAMPVDGPDGTYQVVPVADGLVGWDGQHVHAFQTPQAGYDSWLRSTRPDQACPVWPEELAVLDEALLRSETRRQEQEPGTTVPGPSTPTPTPVAPPAMSPTPVPTPQSTASPVPTPPPVRQPQAVAQGLLALDGWSSAGRYLAYWAHEPLDLTTNPQYPAGTLTLLDTESGDRCAYPRDRYDGAGPERRHAWLPGDHLLVFGHDGQYTLGSGCGTDFLDSSADAPAPIREVAAVSDDHRQLLLRGEEQYWLATVASPEFLEFLPVPDLQPGESYGYSFSPAGSRLGINRGEGGTVVVDTATGAVDHEVSWRGNGGSGAIFPPRWLGEDLYLLQSSQDRGPFLVRGGQIEPFVAELFARDPSPDQVARGAIIAPGEYALLLQHEGGVSLYHSAAGTVEDFRAQEGALDENGHWVFLTNSLQTDKLRYTALRRPLQATGDPLFMSATSTSVPRHFAGPQGRFVALLLANRVSIFTTQVPHTVDYELENYLSAQNARWSPDGEWLAVTGGLSGRREIGIFLLPSP